MTGLFDDVPPVTLSGPEATAPSHAVRALADGRYVAAWRDATGADAVLRFTLFDDTGTAVATGVAATVPANAGSIDFGFDILAFADGGFGFLYSSVAPGNPDATSRSVSLVTVGADATVGTPVQVNLTAALDQRDPAGAVLADGRILSVWATADTLDATPDQIVLRFLEADGSSGSAETVIDLSPIGTAQQVVDLSVTALDDGGAVITWSERAETGGFGFVWRGFSQFVDADGAPVGPQQALYSTTEQGTQCADLTVLTGGAVLAVWYDRRQPDGAPDNLGEIRGRLITPDGAVTGEDLVLNGFLTSVQELPAVAATPDGGFVVVYRDLSNLVDHVLRLARFDALGERIGSDIALDDEVQREIGLLVRNGYRLTELDVLPDGRIVMSYISGAEVLVRVLDTRGGSPIQWNGTVLDDRFHGGRGGDDLLGDDGDDHLFGRTGDDRLGGEDGADLLDGGAGNDRLTGGAGDDTLRGGSGNDILTGDAGADTLDGGTGADRMTGGSGDDAYVFDNAGDRATETAGGGIDLITTTRLSVDLGAFAEVENATVAAGLAVNLTGNALANILTGSGLANTLTGLDGDDTLIGGGGADALDGGNGRDRLDGGAGEDTMTGGAGNDTYLIAQAGDQVIETATGGTDDAIETGSFGIDLADHAFVENVTLSGSGDFALTGSLADNDLTGNSGDNTVLGLGGTDVLRGRDGADRLEGGDGSDTLSGDGGSDRLFGGAGNDRLDGGLGNDSMTGGTGNDTYVIDRASDFVIEAAGGGTDTVESSTVDIRMLTYAHVEHGRLTGTLDLDLTGTEGANVLTGNAGRNLLRGFLGDDRILGLGGTDSLVGDAGADTIIGGAGADILSGGTDADVFVFATGDSGATQATRDRITDFVSGTDRIDLQAVLDAGRFIGRTAFDGTAGQVRFVNGVLQADSDGDAVADFTLALTGVTAITAGDLIL